MALSVTLKDNKINYSTTITIYTDDEIAQRNKRARIRQVVLSIACVVGPLIVLAVSLCFNVNTAGVWLWFLLACVLLWYLPVLGLLGIIEFQSKSEIAKHEADIARPLTSKESEELLALAESRQEIKSVLSYINESKQKTITYDVLYNIKKSLDAYDERSHINNKHENDKKQLSDNLAKLAEIRCYSHSTD